MKFKNYTESTCALQHGCTQELRKIRYCSKTFHGHLWLWYCWHMGVKEQCSDKFKKPSIAHLKGMAWEGALWLTALWAPVQELCTGLAPLDSHQCQMPTWPPFRGSLWSLGPQSWEGPSVLLPTPLAVISYETGPWPPNIRIHIS